MAKSLKRSLRVLSAALIALWGWGHPGDAPAFPRQTRISAIPGFFTGAPAELPRILHATSRPRPSVFTGRPLREDSRAAGSAPARADKPVLAVTSAGPGQAGYVHYFLLRMPDELVEAQIGIELPDQRIAWSFPGLGVVVSPFMEYGVITAGGKEYEVWHLYGIRPFPDDAAMAVLQKEVAGRVNRWVDARIPYCGSDGPDSNCMSCLGFVLRVLFPGQAGGYPDLPSDFWRAGTASRYTTRDLLLYLTGMLDLPSREARLRRIAQLTLPEQLRQDLEDLVYSMGAFEAAPAAKPAPGSIQRRTGSRPANVMPQPSRRGRL